MSTATDTRLMTIQNGDIVTGFSDLSDEGFHRVAADLLKTRDILETLLRAADKDIRNACLELGSRERMWAVNPIILRRELGLRGYDV